MQLDRGPIPVLTPSTDALAPEPAQFAALAAVMLAGASDLELGIQNFTDVQTAAGIPLDFYDASNWIDLAARNADVWEQQDLDGPIADADRSAGVITSELQFVNREAPLEAWQPVPNPDFIPGTSGPFPDIPGPTTITIDNLTRSGIFPMQVGDSFRITINVQSGQGAFAYQNIDEWIIRFLNGVEQPFWDLGNTDQFGVATYTGVWTTADIGTWHMYPLPLGATTNPALDFTIVAAAAPPPPPPPVTYTNSLILLNRTGNINNIFHVGDTFEIRVTGTPGTAIAVHGTINGNPQGTTPVFLGNIGANGTVSFFGTIDAGSIGNWTEQYYFNGVPFGPLLVFNVYQ